MPDKLLLVDAPACANWCYYSVSPRLGAKGRFCSATHRLIGFCLKLIKAEKPSFVAVLFDGKPPFGPPQMAGELRAELRGIRRLFSVAGIPVLEFQGNSVADLAIPLLDEAQQKGVLTLLVTTRTTLLQLVRPGVTLLNPARENLRFDPEKVLKLFGVLPEKLPDWLALVGDEAEEIPGVKGIGPKRAAALLAQHGTVERALDLLPHAPLADSAARIRAGKAKALLTRSSFAGFELQRLHLAEPDPQEVRRQFTEAGLPDLLSELLTHVRPEKSRYEVVLTEEELKRLVGELEGAQAFAIDTETTGLDVNRAGLVGISVAVAAGRAFYIPLGHQDPAVPKQLSLEQVQQALGSLLADPSKLKVGQNMKFDFLVLRRAGLPMAGPLFDTMVASFLIHPDRRSHSLDDLSLAYLGFKMIPYEELASGVQSLADLEVSKVSEYACEDADVTLQLYELFKPKLQGTPLGHLFYEVEMPLVVVLTEVEAAGVPIDLGQAQGLQGEAEEKLNQLSQEIFEGAGERFDLASPKEVRRILVKRLGLTLLHLTRGKQPSLTRASLVKVAHAHPVVKKLIAYQDGTKFLKERLAPLAKGLDPQTGRFFFGLHQAAVGTGKIRVSRFFDAQQLGEWATALRSLVKAPLGSLLLQARYPDLISGVIAVSGSQDLDHFRRKLLLQAKREGKVRTLFLGRERALPQINSPNPVLRQAAEAEAVATVMEGSCGEIVKLALLGVAQRLGTEFCQARLIFVLADGFLLELPEGEAEKVSGLVKEEMEKAAPLAGPLGVEMTLGDRWSALKEKGARLKPGTPSR